MKRFLIAGLLSALMLFPLFGYVYIQGEIDGISRYRHSRQFELALLAMFRLGLQQACADRAICGSLRGSK